MGLIYVSIMVELNTLRFWNRLMDLDHDRLVMKVFFNDLQEKLEL